LTLALGTGASSAQVARIGDERSRMVAYFATPNLFDVLGVAPAMGRPLTSADVRQPVLILSHAAWVSRFAPDPAILSRTFELDGHAYSIAGVISLPGRALERGVDCVRLPRLNRSFVAPNQGGRTIGARRDA